MLPSGRQPTFDNRVGWARTYLAKAGLLEAPKRGVFRISDHGRDVLTQKPGEINVQFLQQFEEFEAFRQLRKTIRSRGNPGTGCEDSRGDNRERGFKVEGFTAEEFRLEEAFMHLTQGRVK